MEETTKGEMKASFRKMNKKARVDYIKELENYCDNLDDNEKKEMGTKEEENDLEEAIL